MNPAAAPNPASSRAKLKMTKLPDSAHSASDATQASVPQRTLAVSPIRLMTLRGNQRAGEIADGIDGVHEARGGIRPAEAVAHVRQHQRIGETADAQADRGRQRRNQDQQRGIRDGRGRGGGSQDMLRQAAMWQASAGLHRPRRAMVSCQSRNAALALARFQCSPSCPALCRASRFAGSKTWMAGTSPAMTNWF